MKPIDYVIILIVGVAVIFSVIKLVKNKKSGKTSCGCDCASCKGCAWKTKEDKNSK